MTRSCCPASSTCTTTSPTTRCRCGPSPAGPSRGCTTSTGPTPTRTPSRSRNPPGSTPRRAPEALLGYVQVRAMAGGATSSAGLADCEPRLPTVVRNVDSEDAGSGKNDLIYTSVVTKTGDALATVVRPHGRRAQGSSTTAPKGSAGRGCCATSPTSQTAEGLLPTFIGIHCCAVDAGEWAKWAANNAGGVVWSPLSNIVLYAQTTLIDDVRAQGVRVCLGSDWGPSGTKNLLGEMKVARIAADRFGYSHHRRRHRRDGDEQPGPAPRALLATSDRPARPGRVRRRHRRPRPRPRQALEAHRRRDGAGRGAGGDRRRPAVRRRKADGRSPERRRRSR